MAQKIFFCNKKQKMWHIRILVLWWWFDSAFITLIIHFIGGLVVFERSVFSKFSDNHFFQVWMKKWLCILLAFCWYALTLHMDGWCWFVKLQFFRENRKKKFLFRRDSEFVFLRKRLSNVLIIRIFNRLFQYFKF